MAEWKPFQIPVPDAVTETADRMSTILKKFRTVLNIILTVLDTAKMFIIDLGNPLKIVLELIVNFIISILNELNQGVALHFLPIAPIVQGQTLLEMKGGIDNFNRKLQASFYDTADSFRPQYTANADLGGFIIAFDSGNAAEILDIVLRFFKLIGESISQNMPAPDNVVAIPVDKDGDDIVSGFSGMVSVAEGIKLRWTVAASGGISMIDSFIPSKWRIERHRTRTGDPFLVDEEITNAAGEKTTIKRQVVDTSGRPVFLWEHVEDISSSDKEFWQGFGTGTYSYTDKNVEEGETWYYRIRSIVSSQPPPIDISSSDVIDGVLYVTGIMGVPCTPIEAFVPGKPEGMLGNPIKALSDTMLAALILGFHIPYKDAPSFEGHGSLSFAYPWLNEYLSLPTANTLFYKNRLIFSIKLAEIIARSLVRSKESFQSFWDLYQEHRGVIEQVITHIGSDDSHPYLDEHITSIDDLRRDVYAVTINLAGAMAVRGDSPNWLTLRASNLIPVEVFLMVRKVEAEARGLLSAYEGLVADILTFIELLEKRIEALNDLITFLESIINILANLSLPGGYTLYIPVEGGGVANFLGRYMSATNPPESGSGNYTMGIALVWGMPGLSTFFGLMQGD